MAVVDDHGSGSGLAPSGDSPVSAPERDGRVRALPSANPRARWAVRARRHAERRDGDHPGAGLSVLDEQAVRAARAVPQ